MTNELSIESIKKEIIDKLMNNMEVLNYLEADKRVAEGIKLNDLYNVCIFDHDSSCAYGNYITVEAAEYDTARVINTMARTYGITIKMGLKNEENICAMSKVITDIVNKLYPDRKRFSNVPVVTVDNCVSVNNYGYHTDYPTFNTVFLENKRSGQLNRMITFYVEN